MCNPTALSGYHLSRQPTEMDIICLVLFRYSVKYKNMDTLQNRCAATLM